MGCCIFTYNKFAVKYFLLNDSIPCLCKDKKILSLVDPVNDHIIADDLNIVENNSFKKRMQLGIKYRLRSKFTYKKKLQNSILILIYLYSNVLLIMINL